MTIITIEKVRSLLESARQNMMVEAMRDYSVEQIDVALSLLDDIYDEVEEAYLL